MIQSGVRGVIAVVLVVVCAVAAQGQSLSEDLRIAEQLAWSKKFDESEALYRSLVTRAPQSGEARVGLARVVMWQGRYREAIALFDAIQPPTADSLEGRATAAYWDGDLRRAARDFRRALSIAPEREAARKSLVEIESLARPSQRIVVAATRDDQPLSSVRSEVAATVFSDPQTRWTASVGGYRLDARRFGDATGQSVDVANETVLGDWTLAARAGFFEFPDGTRRPVGSASVGYGDFVLRGERREELATATSLLSHPFSTAVTMRWSRDRDWIAAAEVTHRRYFDRNTSRAVVAYGVMPFRRGDVTVWVGGSAAARDTERSTFRMTAVSSTFDDGGFFQYQYRGEYDPYWAPDNLVEARLVAAVERRIAGIGVKVHGDGGFARDRGLAFGPDVGPGPFPASTFSFAFDRSYRPWRFGITADYTINSHYTLEVSADRSSTVDYRSTSLHVALVRRH